MIFDFDLVRARWFAVVVVVGSTLLAACGSVARAPIYEPADSTDPSPTMTVLPTLAPTPAPASVTIEAVGDLMLGRSVGYRIESKGPSIVFDEAVASMLRSADITVGNLEMAISDLGYPQEKGYTFEAPPVLLSALTLGGFDMVSQANNHALDYGPEALLDTARNLRAAGIEFAGSGPNLESALAPAVLERNGLRIAFVSLVDTPAEGGYNRTSWEASADTAGVAWADVESVTRAVSEAKASADVVVAMLHFGIEYSATPTDDQRAMAHAAIEAGATLVVGSHPHVLQPVEEYKGGLVAYSLGNFVFDGFDGSANESAILRVTLTAEGIDAWELLPVELIENGLPRLTQP